MAGPDYSADYRHLLWPPAWEEQANKEGWTLRDMGFMVEVDFLPPRSDDTPIYHGLMMWLILNAYVIGSPMHLTAWQFEYAANQEIYDAGRVPGDGMCRATNPETGETVWIENGTGRVWSDTGRVWGGA